ncbi:MAG: Ribosome-binding factor A RbfA [Candidatus Jorgensenbacteria bacterium GW2011_GWA1_48_11]|uniref:Ribosome-binding factor A RbfA n=1 Tax=Candidatus Jorgensenbacteria bacterium GW2011_GWA1_48_11 TaxID=1618660 RepID=A0A0G1UC13_9BACT|nr:MAG: Ribosome-binding factor A RbfA [Candidatus Jorgensenbacteria bacterium GW2011_GWA1_48_11]KKW12154.1 MAG: Ribosome-binding factor A RbfA [Candidatus Jorgensenbacteria bacterium GW2011_GWB1_49_9]
MRPYRDLKIGNLIQEELSRLILRNFDFENTLVTVTKVEITPDLLQAKVSLGIIPFNQGPMVFRALEAQRRELQHRLLKKINIKPMPHLKFLIEEETAT